MSLYLALFDRPITHVVPEDVKTKLAFFTARLSSLCLLLWHSCLSPTFMSHEPGSENPSENILDLVGLGFVFCSSIIFLGKSRCILTKE